MTCRSYNYGVSCYLYLKKAMKMKNLLAFLILTLSPLAYGAALAADSDTALQQQIQCRLDALKRPKSPTDATEISIIETMVQGITSPSIKAELNCGIANRKWLLNLIDHQTCDKAIEKHLKYHSQKQTVAQG